MAKLIYSSIASLDGFVADDSGNFDWAMPDAEVHSAVNELMAGIGTQLMGRRLYEIMRAWDTIDDDEPEMVEFASLWRGSDKVVYSGSLEAIDAPRTRLERQFQPEQVQQLKHASARDLSVGGPNLAGQALRAGLVDEIHLYTSPVIVGGGTPLWPTDLRIDLELLTERRFANGIVHTAYRPR